MNLVSSDLFWSLCFSVLASGLCWGALPHPMVIIQLISVQNPELSPTVPHVFLSDFLQLSIHELSNTSPVLSNHVSDWLRVKATFLTDKVEEIKWYYNISRESCLWRYTLPTLTWSYIKRRPGKLINHYYLIQTVSTSRTENIWYSLVSP